MRHWLGWMVDPIYWQVNALRDATVRALDQTDTQIDAPRDESQLRRIQNGSRDGVAAETRSPESQPPDTEA